MAVIDFHNHFYPPEYLESIKTGQSAFKVTTDDDNNPVLHSPGDKNYIVPGHRDIDFRENVIEKAGVDMQVITFTAPGTLIETPERSVELARIVNDALAKIVKERSSKFTSLATLPLNDPDASVVEFERVISELGFKGVMLYSNANGIALSDKRFWKLYEKANEVNAVMYIHPTYPVGVEAMEEYWLMPLIGFTYDTTLAAAKLVYSGVVEKFPNISWVLGHLGGAIPFLVERLDRGYTSFKECRENISRLPSEYLKEFYYDTVNFDVNALQLAIDFAGTDHILAGSDYPHMIGSIGQMLESIGQLDITPEEKAGILGGNAAKLLGLT